jgi:hypothetical protein
MCISGGSHIWIHLGSGSYSMYKVNWKKTMNNNLLWIFRLTKLKLFVSKLQWFHNICCTFESLDWVEVEA